MTELDDPNKVCLLVLDHLIAKKKVEQMYNKKV